MPEWKGILNEPICDESFTNAYKSFRKDNVAIVISDEEFIRSRVKCNTFEMRNLLPRGQGTFWIRVGFPFKEKLNVAYTRLKTSGVIDRALIKYHFIILLLEIIYRQFTDRCLSRKEHRNF